MMMTPYCRMAGSGCGGTSMRAVILGSSSRRAASSSTSSSISQVRPRAEMLARLAASSSSSSSVGPPPSRPTTGKQRNEDLSSSSYDLLIVGAGATGSGAALDAAARGLRVACVDRGDFGGETSSRSTKLIWAGSRYLFNVVAALTSKQMLLQPRETVKKCWDEFKMVLGCARERRYMAERNPHLVNWMPIALPFDRWLIWPPPMGAWAFAFMPLACRLNAVRWCYDSLAGFSSPTSYVMSRGQAAAKFPQLGQRYVTPDSLLSVVSRGV